MDGRALKLGKPPRPRMSADPHFHPAPIAPPSLEAGPRLPRAEAEELYRHIDGGGMRGPLPDVEDVAMAGAPGSGTGSAAAAAPRPHGGAGAGSVGDGYDMRVGSVRPAFGRPRRLSAPSASVARRLEAMASALAAAEAGAAGADGTQLGRPVQLPPAAGVADGRSSTEGDVATGDAGGATGTGPRPGDAGAAKRTSLTRSLSSDSVLKSAAAAAAAAATAAGASGAGTANGGPGVSAATAPSSPRPPASPASSVASAGSRLSRAFGHMFSSFGSHRKPSPPPPQQQHGVATAGAAQPPSSQQPEAPASGASGSGSGGILRKLSSKLGGGGGGSPDAAVAVTKAPQPPSITTTSPPSAAAAAAAAALSQGEQQQQEVVTGRQPVLSTGATGAVGLDSAASAPSVGGGDASGRLSPSAELALVDALLVAKRKAARALQQAYTLAMAAAAAPSGGSRGAAAAASSAGTSAAATASATNAAALTDAAVATVTTGALAEAVGLPAGEVGAGMAEIEAEARSDAAARVGSLSPVALEAFDVTADALVGALVAEARRRARLKALYELRRLTGGGVDLTSYGPAVPEDDDTLALIDAHDGGTGCALLVGRKLRLNDEPWRKLVREATKLPAFLGVVLFQRAVEASVLADAETALLAHGCVQLRAGAAPDRAQPWPAAGGAGGGGGSGPRGLSRLNSASPTAGGGGGLLGAHHAHNRSFFFSGGTGADGGGVGGTPTAAQLAAMGGGSGLLPGGGLSRRASDIGFGGAGLLLSSGGSGFSGGVSTVPGVGHVRTMTLARTLSAAHGFGGDEGRAMSPRLRYAHGGGGGGGPSSGAGGPFYDGNGGGSTPSAATGVTASPLLGGGDASTWGVLFPVNPEEAYWRRANERIRGAVRLQALAGTIGVLDFLRVWHHALDDGPRPDKLLALLNPSPDPVLAALTLETRTEVRRQLRTLRKSGTREPGAATGGGGGTTAAPAAAPPPGGGHPPTHPPVGGSGGGTTSGGAGRRQLTTTGLSVPAATVATAAAAATVGDATAASSPPPMDESTAKVLAMVRLQKLSLARKLLAAGLAAVPPPVRLLTPSPDFPAQHRVAGADLAPCVEALVERHPDLAPLRDKPLQRGRYLTAVLSAVFASLPQGLSLQGVPVVELRHSNVAESLWACSTTSVVGIAPYSMRFFSGLESDFASAAHATKVDDDREAAKAVAAAAVAGKPGGGGGGLQAAAAVAGAHLRKRSEFGFASLLGGGGAGAGNAAPTAAAARPPGLTINVNLPPTAGSSGGGAGGGGGDEAVEVVHSPDALTFTTAPAPAAQHSGEGAPRLLPGSPGGLFGGGSGGLATPRNSRAAQKKLRMPDPDPGADDKATVSLAAFTRQCDVLVTQLVLERVFAGVARPLMSGVRGRLCFEDFVWLACMQHQRMMSSSSEYFLRCLDLDDDGTLGPGDLAAAFHAKATHLAAAGKTHVASVREAMAILMDALTPARPEVGVTRLDIKRSGCGPILFDMLVSAAQPRSITAASVNLRLVTSPHALYGGCGEV